MKSRERKLGIAFVCASAVWGASPHAFAAYPEKPVRWIVNAAAGGAADATVRVVANALARRLEQPFIVDNRPGAAGAIGLDAIAKAAPDGYTIGTANLSTFVVGAAVAKKLPYSVARDFSPIAMLTTQPNLLGVNADLPIRSVGELVAYSKAHPGQLFYGSSGNGTALHVVTEMFRNATGADITHVPYKSTVAAEADLAAGQIQLMIDNFSTMVPNVQSGRVRPIAITSPTRSARLPAVPTFAEAGVPGVEMLTWGGVVGPAKMPAAVVKKLNAEINAVLSDPRIARQLQELGADAAPMAVDQFTETLVKDHAKWEAIVQQTRISD